MTATAVRPLRAAVIGALKLGVSGVFGRVYTIPAPQGGPFPYLTVGGYTETRDNFIGRKGSAVEFNIKGYYRNALGQTGDDGVMALYDEVYATLHSQTLLVDGHLHLLGYLLLNAGPYMDPDGKTLQWVARYEANTKNVLGELS